MDLGSTGVPVAAGARSGARAFGRVEHWLLIACIYATMFMFGFSDNAKTITYPLIKLFHDVSDTRLGLMMSIGGIGYPAACCVSLLTVRWWGPKGSLMTGLVCMVLGCLGMSLLPSFNSLYPAQFMLTFSLGMLEISMNVMVTSLFTKNTVVYMTVFQGFYGLGSIAIPYVGAGLIHLMKKDYKSVYWGVLAGAVLALAGSLLTRFDHPNVKPLDKLMGVRQVVKKPLVWVFVATLALMEILEYGTTDWGTVYLQQVFGMDAKKEGALFATLFFVSFTISRLCNGIVVEKMGYFRFCFIGYSLTVVIMVVGFIVGRAGLYILPFTGIFIGLSWPIMMSLCVKVFRDDAPIVSSVIIVVGCAINIASQLLIGVANDYIGAAWGYRLVTICPVLILLMLCVLWRMTRERMAAVSDLSAPLLSTVDPVA